MSQTYERRCPTCGNSIAVDQRFCTNCGTVLEAESPPPPSQYGAQPPSQSYPYSQPPPYAQQPPPYAQPQVPSYAQSPQPMYAQQQPQQQSPIAEAFGALGLLFLLRGFGGRKYAGYRPQRQRSSCCGCLVLLAVLFLCIGVPSLYYASKTSLSGFSKSLNDTYNSNSSSSSDSSSITTQPPITTTQINQTVPYGGADITIVNVQQSKAFMNDLDAGTTGVVRLNIKENSSASGTNYVYSDVARLIMPDKTTVAPYNEQQSSGPDASVARTNWIDFQVPTSVQVSQLTLQLGKDTEAQELITLNGKANLAQYQTKTTHPANVTTQYAGLTWTVTAVTVSLDYKGQQAAKGMQFVTASFNVDNPSSQDFSAYWGDYMRLKSGGTTSAPSSDTNFPTSFAAGSSGGTGDVDFIMPAGSNSFTFLFLSTPSFPTASSISFQTS
ncbi:MAG TPA: zinc ribbon domain-containing protein [Ktedonobacteraceae bacterium]|nr:zinc ribbon domain-containing protein [Ktedonobacteraceae bacterium]